MTVPQDNEENPARQAMIDIVKHMVGNPYDAKFRADWILTMLAERGLKIVPIEPDDPYEPNENTVRISKEDWARINRGEK